MIDEKKIEEAAIECAKEYYSIDLGKDREEVNREIFTKGAHWALQEFKKSLWHDASEEPKQNTQIIFKMKNGTKSTVFYQHSKKWWKNFCSRWNITHWCNLLEIFPNEEGGEE